MRLLLLAVVAAGALPAAYGHGLGLDGMTATIDGTSYDITAELPLQFGDDSSRLTITIQESAGEAASDVVLQLGMVHSGRQILQDTFHAPAGVLSLDVYNRPAAIEIDAPRQDGIILAEPAGTAVYGPLFGAGGLYTLYITVESVGGVPVLDDRQAVLDLLVLDEAFHTGTDESGAEVSFATKSYFDRVSNFHYDAPSGTITFEMPFDWSAGRMSHIPVIHQEVHFPKDFEEFVTRGYLGRINDVALFRSSVTIDDFTNLDERTIHFVILQDHLNLIKSQMDRPGGSLPDTMVFTLEKTQSIRSQMSAFTRNGDFQVDMTWEPETILPDQKTKFIFTIRDANTAETLRNSEYDFVIMQDGSQLYRNSGVARVGGDFQEFAFAEEHGGTATVHIQNIRGTDQSVEFAFVVVPEFGALLVLALSVAALVLLTRRGLPYKNGIIAP